MHALHLGASKLFHLQEQGPPPRKVTCTEIVKRQLLDDFTPCSNLRLNFKAFGNKRAGRFGLGYSGSQNGVLELYWVLEEK